MSVRKHFYLITEHEDDDKVGGVLVYDNRMTVPLKNEEGKMSVFDEDDGDFRTVGKRVGLGYHDFASEAESQNSDVVAGIMQEKVRDVDRKWAKKAGIVDVVYNGGDDE